jgi:hypothetical protein
VRWRIPARVVANVVVYIEAETKKEALRKFRAHDWEEQSDQDVSRISKSGPIAPDPRSLPERERARIGKFTADQRVRYKDGRRGRIIGGHGSLATVHLDGEAEPLTVAAHDLRPVKPEHDNDNT